MIKIVLVDDQELLRLGFRMILEAAEDIEVLGEAGDGALAVELTARCHPDVVLMDIRMPVMDGIEATRQIVARDPRVRVLALTTFDLDEYAFGALRAGASGFLLKDVPPAELQARFGQWLQATPSCLPVSLVDRPRAPDRIRWQKLWLKMRCSASRATPPSLIGSVKC